MKFTRIWTETVYYCKDEDGFIYRRDPDGRWFYGGKTGQMFGTLDQSEADQLEATFFFTIENGGGIPKHNDVQHTSEVTD